MHAGSLGLCVSILDFLHIFQKSTIEFIHVHLCRPEYATLMQTAKFSRKLKPVPGANLVVMYADFTFSTYKLKLNASTVIFQ